VLRRAMATVLTANQLAVSRTGSQIKLRRAIATVATDDQLAV